MPNATDALDRLRDHDPALILSPLSTNEREAIRDRIVASLTVPRSRRVADRVRRLGRTARPRRLAVSAAAFLLVAASATAAVIGSGILAHVTPVALFEANAGQHPALTGQKETVITSTVQAARTFAVPGVGQVALWTGTTRQGGFCMALLLPGATWAGFSASAYDTGYGSVGCQPTTAQVNQYAIAQGGKPILDPDDGFQYDNAILRGSDGREWDIYYGRVIPTHGQPATVRDQISGLSAPVTSDGWFAITVPMPDPPTTQPHIQLQALDSTGQVIAQEPSAASA